MEYLIMDLIRDYLTHVQLYKRNGTYDYYKKISRSIEKALRHCKLENTSDLKKNSIDQIVIYFKNHTVKKNSQINADIGFLYTVLRYYDVKTEIPSFTKLPDDTTSFKALNDVVLDQLLLYLKTLDTNESNYLSWRLAIYLMLDTGVRMNELLNIKTRNVDIYSRSIILETTKSGKKRVVFFNDLSYDHIIKSLKKNTEYLIWNHVKNERMNRTSIFYFMNKIADALGNRDNKIHCHRLRKTFATRLLKKGCPLTTIQKLLGHSDIKMTMVYLEIDDVMIEKDYFKFYPY